ncbi:hypothetical protein EM6_2748 [Asticcacaulis excentricus]|uniref:Uncharacterized protein n=1 Tax=Asticcacaulis excentricus TaxID=78587 RepID=A0A3G9G896_9CAUL|nr:hypothetical protein EM6_2748 [Asticcacaulis excentricus]
MIICSFRGQTMLAIHNVLSFAAVAAFVALVCQAAMLIG